ncbi:hypothetical protein E0H80_09220 [Acinetobacter sp. ANC 4779]|uniref:transposase n=1 Tax=Acinetobacter sp. ANC 4779 TaxID=2529848 RepID=UPI00103C8470|nr:transposase [Acinetobacter sp. ANC 4779]TCB50460.1 hypothetical protein E0H80_09220 [Acinetobacter sp. ANC 4779]
MTRRILTDDTWLQTQETMEFYGWYRSRNSKNIIEAMLRKLRISATWRYIPENLCPRQMAYNRFNR